MSSSHPALEGCGVKVVVGLGNPGPKYDRTRHNVGFVVVDELATRLGAGKSRLRFEANLAEGSLGTEKVLLAAPQTYMNASGRSIRQIIDFYGLPLSDVILVCDDFNLELARLRMRSGGSAGGQKGLADTIRHLGTEEFPRLRIGIGRPPEQMDPADFVLSRFRRNEEKPMEAAVIRAAEGIEIWIRSGLNRAMNQVNAPSDD
jgi:PTH1 family peptidyl-tRNA hydrolase